MIERSFETESLILNDVSVLLGGNGVPWVEYPDAPEGSTYFRSNGSTYTRVANTISGEPTDWSDTSQGTLTGQVLFCLADGSQDNIPLIQGSFPFYLTNGIFTPIGII